MGTSSTGGAAEVKTHLFVRKTSGSPRQRVQPPAEPTCFGTSELEASESYRI